jgi:hypothetical protein
LRKINETKNQDISFNLNTYDKIFNRSNILFNTEMDKIYDTIIKSKKFDKNITEMLFEYYNQEKEIHNLNLIIEFSNNFINQIE